MEKVRRFTDTPTFRAVCGPYMEASEPEHNLVFGILTAIEAGLYESFHLAAVMDGDEVVAVTLRTPPYQPVISPNAPLDAVNVLADDFASDQPDIPGVLASPEGAQRFASRWQELTGTRPEPGMRQRIHMAEHAEVPDGVPGAMRDATPDDADLFVEWMTAFQTEALDKETDPNAVRERFLGRFTQEESGIVMWEDGGPVSMAGFSGRTPNGIRIGPVYTPPELRGRGYATACTGTLTSRLLDAYLFCFLFTDQDNPVSNHIYARIGYRPVCDVHQVKFPGA